MLDRLLHEHSRIRVSADLLEAIIAARQPEDATAFWRLRWSLLSLILQNLRHEKMVVTSPLLRDPRPDAVELAERFETELAEISSRYLDHIIRWNSDEDMVAWTRYGDQVVELIAVLRDRMEREERLLYPLIWPDMGREDRSRDDGGRDGRHDHRDAGGADDMGGVEKEESGAARLASHKG